MLETLGKYLRLLRRSLLFLPLLLLAGAFAGKALARILVSHAPARRREAVLQFPEIRHTSDTALRRAERLARTLPRESSRTLSYVRFYNRRVRPAERFLHARGVAPAHARKIAWAVSEEAQRSGLGSATVLAVLYTESQGHPHAVSPVGARGLMQVMPFWAGRLRCGSSDLFDVRSNICHGTTLLAQLKRSQGGDERDALLSYNGCTRGNARCRGYPDAVMRIRRSALRYGVPD